MSSNTPNQFELNITLKTIDKVRQAIINSGEPVSMGHIAITNGLHWHRVKRALEELKKNGEVKEIKNSTNVPLYEKNDIDD